jgi:hypothetical protein
MRKIRAYLLETREEQWQAEVIRGPSAVPDHQLNMPSAKIFSRAMHLKDFLDGNLATREIPNRMTERLEIIGERDLIRNRRLDLPMALNACMGELDG